MNDRNSRLKYLLACSLIVGCAPTTPRVAETPPPPVTISQVVSREVVEQDEFEGRIKAAEYVEIRARVRGHLMKVAFQAGQLVKQGELLYEIDPRQYKASLDAAEAQLKAAQASEQYAKSEYQRLRKLVASNAASREELEVWTAKQVVATGDVLKAKASVEQAELDLNFTKITAPITGKIGRSLVDVGNLINSGGGETLLTTIVSVEPMYVYFNIDERSLIRYLGTPRKDAKPESLRTELKGLHIPVYVALENDRGYPHKGELDFADNRVDPNTGTIEVRGVLDNSDRAVIEGMRARVRIPVSDPTKMLMVTERAVGSEQGRKFVYVVNAENIASRRDVVPGRVMDGMLTIREGLTADDWIIVNGILRVRDGMKVDPHREPMPGSAPPASTPAPKAAK
jgi:RND family efflux transporter MFP subunit